jgi:5'(3')-deoxyribonucleotidase
MIKPNWTYVDMDGVIADFFKALALEFGVNHWKDIPTQEDVIERLKGTDFFSRIPMFPTTIKFLHMIERYTKGRWSILSTPLKGDEENSAKHKDIWLDNLFGYAFDNDFDKKRFYSAYKWKWATTIDWKEGRKHNLLIDDRPTNLEEFKKHGGLTIRYQANESKIDKFEQKLKDLFQPLATKELQHG